MFLGKFSRGKIKSALCRLNCLMAVFVVVLDAQSVYLGWPSCGALWGAQKINQMMDRVYALLGNKSSVRFGGESLRLDFTIHINVTT